MSVFKVIGTIVRVLEGGKEREEFTKTYIRADDEQEVRVKATEQGFVSPKIEFFCKNHENNLGEAKYYGADNGHGILQGF